MAIEGCALSNAIPLSHGDPINDARRLKGVSLGCDPITAILTNQRVCSDARVCSMNGDPSLMHGDPPWRTDHKRLCVVLKRELEQSSSERQLDEIRISRRDRACTKYRHDVTSLSYSATEGRTDVRTRAIITKERRAEMLQSIFARGCFNDAQRSYLSMHCDPNQSKGVSPSHSDRRACLPTMVIPWRSPFPTTAILTNQRMCFLPGRSKGVLSQGDPTAIPLSYAIKGRVLSLQ